MLFWPRALAPFRLTKIAFPGIRPKTAVVPQCFAEFVEHFGSDSDAPASKGFPSRARGSFFFPSRTHSGNFEQVWALGRHR